MKSLTTLLAILSTAALMTTGCAVNRASATIDPTADLGTVKSIYVKKFEPDGRGIDLLIAERLRLRGYAATAGAAKPASMDAVVTYVDKWFWDITMYMLELSISIRDPKTDYPLASGNSLHTSLTRLSPTEMVDEVLDNIFKKGE